LSLTAAADVRTIRPVVDETHIAPPTAEVELASDPRGMVEKAKNTVGFSTKPPDLGRERLVSG
jgi:hypothetical protein